MNIEELSKELYEGLNGRITGVDFSDDLEIYFQYDDWNDYDVTRKFKITCHGVEESEVQPSATGSIEFTDEHQLLWNHNDSWGYLYYTSEPRCRFEILGRLWEIHEKAFGGWRRLKDYANTYNAGQQIEFCKGSNGQLARGPKTLLDLYQSAVSDQIETNFVSSIQPKRQSKALVFDDCFVICKSVTVDEIGS